MQSQVLVEIVQTEEALERRLFHLLHVGEAHVVGDEQQDLFRFVIGEAKAAADFFSQAHTHIYMPIETDAIGRDAERSRFTDIVE
jgi:hypothetical protein